MADQTSPLRRSQAIAPYSDAEQSLLDNAFASPFTRSLQQVVNTDVAGTYRQQALEAQVRGDAAGQRAAEYNRQSALRRMDLPTVGPTTWDAAKETGNYGDYVQNVLGSMAGSMVKPLVGSSIGGLVGGLPGAAIGGFGGSFSAIRNAELENYANDEQLKTLSPEEQLRVTRNSAALQAIPEAIMPAYLGAGGRLPGALNRAPTALRVAGGVAAGGGTEGLQDYISQRVAQAQFPDREIDWGNVRENFVAGLIGGGAMGVLGRHDVDGGATTPAARPAAGEVSPMDAVPPTDGGGGGLFSSLGERFGPGLRDTAQKAKGFVDRVAGTVQDGYSDDIAAVADTVQERFGDGLDSIGEKAKGLAGAVNDRFGDDFASAGEKAKDFAGRATRKAKGFVSDTLDRMTEAVNTAENPGDFLSKVFGGSIEDEAAADMTGEPNPALKGLTFEETEANIARDDAKKVARAARYADELLNDPATPDAVKQRVMDMQGDYANPDNQAFVARTLVAQRGGEKVMKAVQDLVDLGKSAFAKGSEAASAAKKAAGDAAIDAQERIIKKNLQSASPAEQAAFNKVIFDNLTEEAKASTFVRAQLSQMANVLMAFAAKTGDITAKDLPVLTKLANAMSMFKDPDALAAQLVEYGAIPRDADSFLGRVKSIQNARTDIKQPNSFLYTSLTPEAKDSMTGPMLQRLAQLVDEFSLQDAAGKGDKVLEGLTQAFGSPESARAVLDFYAKQNKANLRFDPNEQVRDAAGEIDSDELSSWEGSINERDAGKAMFRFKDAKSMRPFFKGSKDIDNARRDGTLGDESTQTPYSYAEYVKETGKDPEAELNRLFKIIDDLVAEHKKHKKEDRSAMINPLLGERSMVEAAYERGGAEEALSLYEVLRTEAKDQNDLVATDEDLAKYSFKKGASRVTFKRTDGTKLMLSAESMWKTFGDKTKGETSGGKEGDTARARRLFKEAVASVLARPDIESLETSLSGLKIDSKGTEAEPKIDPVLREQIAHELNKASGSLSELKAGLQKIFKGYATALSQGNLGKQLVYTTEEMVRNYIANAQKALDGATTAPQRAVLRERLTAYERGLERMMEMKQNYLDDGVGGNNNTDAPDPPIFSRLRKEMDTSEGERRVEEDTGAPVGTGGAPSMKTAPKKDLPEPKAKAKPSAKNPAAASREKAAKIDDTSALSADAFTALHDVVVKENWGRLDTPAKVLRFAAMARKALEQISKTPELDRTDEQDLLRFMLKDMFDQDKGAVFDWDSLWDGLEPTDAQKAQLEGIVRPKAEPGTVRQSTMNPKRGRPGKVDRQAVIDEIIRTRGKDVKVAMDKLHSALGGSGQYTYNRKTGQRLIEVAINAIDPVGTARHEAMHDFFQFLGENEATRAVARTLKEVMGSKEVMDKLKDLLQGHKDALEQLNDPEERVAYAYQFWAAGALDLGPKSTGIFRTITNFLRDMFGIVTKEQRALDILNAFHDGDFSNVSTVREALFDQAERDGATFWEKMNHMAPALNKAVLAMSSAAPDRLRRFENDSLNALADKFFTDGGKQGFIQNRFQQEGIWSNKLEAAFAGSTAEERRIALEQLQSMKPVSPLAKKLAEFNSEMYDYMSAAGVKTFDRQQKKWVPIRRVNNYFTRSWDGDAIARNRSGFVQLLMSEGGLSLDAAEEVADKLINGREERLTPQEQSILGFTPYAVHTAERVFGFIKPGNADEFAKFQKKDITDIMSNYVQQAVYRAEYARSFGNDGRVISDLIAASGITDKDELTAISNTVQAMEGSLDPDKWSSSTKELMSVMMTAQNVILLPLAIASQVVDPIILAARTGDLRDAGTAYVNSIKRLWNTVSKNGKKVDGEDLAYILGVVSENSTLQAMGMTASTTRMGKRMEEINRKFFRYNGMQGWNNTMRITATAAAERYIIANKDNAEALAELGIKPGDVKMSTVYVPDGKGKLVAKHSLDVSSREVQQAMFKMVDQSVLRPSAANRPVWMSDPRFLLVGHLKQFTFAMHNVVLKRANKQLENGNAKPWLILALAAPAVLAADMAKFALTGDMPSSWGFFEYLSHAVNRSGLLGIGDFGTKLFSGVGQGKLPGEGLLGPSFEHVAEILRWVGGDPRTEFEDVVDRTIPFAKYV